jgi:hypothetical protein
MPAARYLLPARPSRSLRAQTLRQAAGSALGLCFSRRFGTLTGVQKAFLELADKLEL